MLGAPDADVRAVLARQLELGFRTIEDIVDRAVDVFDGEPGAPDLATLRRWAVEELARYLGRRERHAHGSDAERVVRAFHALERRGILARHAVGVTPTDGFAVVYEELLRVKAAGGWLRGYVYYAGGEALDAVVADGELALSFAPLGVRPEDQLAAAQRLGEEIVRVLEREGLRTSWDGDPRRFIRLVGLRWLAPRAPMTGDPVLRWNERETHVRAYVRDETDHWRVRIAVVAASGASAHALVERVHGVVSGRPSAAPFDAAVLESDGIVEIDFVPLALPPVNGHPIRFVLRAMAADGAEEAFVDEVLDAHGLVVVADTRERLDAALAMLRPLDVPPLVVAVEGPLLDHRELAAVVDAPVVSFDAVAASRDVMDPVKAIVKLVLTDLKRSASLARA